MKFFKHSFFYFSREIFKKKLKNTTKQKTKEKEWWRVWDGEFLNIYSL